MASAGLTPDSAAYLVQAVQATLSPLAQPNYRPDTLAPIPKEPAIYCRELFLCMYTGENPPLFR